MDQLPPADRPAPPPESAAAILPLKSPRPAPPLLSERQQFAVTLVVGLAGFMVLLDGIIVNIALPTITEHYNASASESVWVLLAYLLILTSTMLFFGKLSDRLGLKRIFCAGFLLFTLASALCALAPSLLFLILGRALQGLGGAMIYTISFALVPRYLPPDKAARAFGLIASIAMAGAIVGAPLGGFITAALSWHWIFLINVPVGVVVLAITEWAIPADPPVRHHVRVSFDSFGAALSCLGLVCLIYGLNMGEEYGWLSLETCGSLAFAVVLLGDFYRHERRVSSPLLDLRLFQDRVYSFGLLAAMTIMLEVAGMNFFLPFYLQDARGVSPSATGLLLMLYALVQMGLGPFVGRLTARWGMRPVMLVGLGCACAGFVFFSLTLTLPGVGSALAMLLLLGIGNGLFLPANNTLVMSRPAEKEQGEAAGAFKTMSNLGMALGVTLFELAFSLGLPGVEKERQLSQLPLEMLHHAFFCTALFGAVVLAGGFVAGWLATPGRRAPSKRGHKHGRK